MTEAPASPPIVDTHTHLDDPAFDPDRDTVIEASRAAGVRHFRQHRVCARSVGIITRVAGTTSGYRFRSWPASATCRAVRRRIASRPRKSDRVFYLRLPSEKQASIFPDPHPVSKHKSGHFADNSRSPLTNDFPRSSISAMLRMRSYRSSIAGRTWHRLCFTRSTAHSVSRTGPKSVAASSE